MTEPEKNVSVLCIGDPHFKRTNILDVDKFMKATISVAKSENPDIIIVLGDLLDKHDVYHAEPFNRAIKFLEALRKISFTFLIIGNHDYSSNGQFLTDKHAFVACKSWDNFVVVDKVQKYEINDHIFFMVPYVPPGRFEEALNTTDDVWETASCIFAHQEFQGCKMGHINSIDGDKWEEDYPAVISGHIHDAQTVGDNIFYPGSSMQHGYAENTDKKIWNVEFSWDNDGELCLSIDEIDLGLPKRKLVTLTPEQADKFSPSKYKNTHVKIAISSTRSEFQAFRKSKTHKRLVQEGVIITFKPSIHSTQLAISEKMKSVHKKYGTKFTNVLVGLIRDENNDELINVYNEIMT